MARAGRKLVQNVCEQFGKVPSCIFFIRLYFYGLHMRIVSEGACQLLAAAHKLQFFFVGAPPLHLSSPLVTHL